MLLASNVSWCWLLGVTVTNRAVSTRGCGAKSASRPEIFAWLVASSEVLLACSLVSARVARRRTLCLRLAVFSKVRGARRYHRSEGLSWGLSPECPAQGEAGGGLCEISWRRPLLFCSFSCCPSCARPILSSSSLLEAESAVAARAVPFPVALSAYVAVRAFCRGGAYVVERREFELPRIFVDPLSLKCHLQKSDEQL